MSTITCLSGPMRLRSAVHLYGSRLVDSVVHLSGPPRCGRVCGGNFGGTWGGSRGERTLAGWTRDGMHRVCGGMVVGTPATGITGPARAGRGGPGRRLLCRRDCARLPARRGLRAAGRRGNRDGRRAAFRGRHGRGCPRAGGLDPSIYTRGGFGTARDGGLCVRGADPRYVSALSLGRDGGISLRLPGRSTSAPGSGASAVPAGEPGGLRLRGVPGAAWDLLCDGYRRRTKGRGSQPGPGGRAGTRRRRPKARPHADHAVRTDGRRAGRVAGPSSRRPEWDSGGAAGAVCGDRSHASSGGVGASRVSGGHGAVRAPSAATDAVSAGLAGCGKRPGAAYSLRPGALHGPHGRTAVRGARRHHVQSLYRGDPLPAILPPPEHAGGCGTRPPGRASRGALRRRVPALNGGRGGHRDRSSASHGLGSRTVDGRTHRRMGGVGHVRVGGRDDWDGAGFALALRVGFRGGTSSQRSRHSVYGRCAVGGSGNGCGGRGVVVGRSCVREWGRPGRAGSSSDVPVGGRLAGVGGGADGDSESVDSRRRRVRYDCPRPVAATSPPVAVCDLRPPFAFWGDVVVRCRSTCKPDARHSLLRCGTGRRCPRHDPGGTTSAGGYGSALPNRSLGGGVLGGAVPGALGNRPARYGSHHASRRGSSRGVARASP